jgi:hypothetical protein
VKVPEVRKIAIIGAGQAGLLLGIALLDRNYRVTLISDRTAEQVLYGPIPAGAAVFHDALQIEREMGLALWDQVATMISAVHIDVAAPGGDIGLSIEAPLDQPGLCIDQRLKIARWMEIFTRRGGRLVVKPATLSDIEDHARVHDLVVIATGKGELGRLFPRDDARSPFREPPRHISMVIVAGLPPWNNFTTPGLKFRILPGAGEIFSAPMYMYTGVQSTFLGIEAIPGGPLDRVTRGMTAEAQLAVTKELFRELVPWDYDAIRDAAPGDHRDCLFGAFVPVVRKPFGSLPSGAVVMAIADAVNLQDPIAAQGANSAAKMARLVRDRIIERADRPFDATWMESVFDEAWDYLKYGNWFCEKLLRPPEPHAMEILGAASQNAAVASRFVNGLNHPPSLFPWYAEPAEAHRFLASQGCRRLTEQPDKKISTHML